MAAVALATRAPYAGATDGEAVRVVVDPASEPPRSVQCLVGDEGAWDLSADDRGADLLSPRIPPGTYELEVVWSDGSTSRRPVEVTAGRETRIELGDR